MLDRALVAALLAAVLRLKGQFMWKWRGADGTPLCSDRWPLTEHIGVAMILVGAGSAARTNLLTELSSQGWRVEERPMAA